MANHILYRHFDSDETLLYIGITNDVRNRFKQHDKEKEWWKDVRHCTFDHFPTRAALEEAEVEAIRNERPKYNVIHNQQSRIVLSSTPLNDRLAKLETKVNQLCEIIQNRKSNTPLPEWISKEQFLEVTGLKAGKFDLLKKYELLPEGSFKMGGRVWRLNRDATMEFAESDLCNTLRFNNNETCSELIEKLLIKNRSLKVIGGQEELLSRAQQLSRLPSPEREKLKAEWKALDQLEQEIGTQVADKC
jgi:predicted GIY-YIG superfamily endonuclease